MSNFRIGEKVVCINAENQKFGQLVKGEIYEVSGIFTIFGELAGVYVNDFKIPNHPWRFRKLDYQFGHDICAELSKQYNEDFVEL